MFAPDLLRGKTALVTGASSGLGRHFARTLSAAGARVILAARREAQLNDVAESIRALGGDARTVRLDVMDSQSVKSAFAEVEADIVVNNAGVTHDGPALTTTAEDWGRVIGTDLTGVFWVAQAAASQMRARGSGGVIVNIASILAKRVAGNLSAYAAAKAGVVQLTRSLALEWARYSIRVNALCPGYVETELNVDFFASEPGRMLINRIPQRRLGQVEDLDGPLLLLASDAGAFMTGADLIVDGGHLVTSL